MSKILIIDDNEDIRKIIGYDLLKAGFEVEDVEDAQKGYQKILQDNDYDLIIIDWMMPKMSGIELVTLLRQHHINSILFMLTAKDGMDDLEQAFAAGVDDYMHKPFSPRELEIRIRHHLQLRKPQPVKGQITFADIVLNEQNRRVQINKEEISLTRKEFDMLAYYLHHPNTVLSRNEILNALWGFDYDGDTRIVDVHTFKLRNKLKNSQAQITSSRGIGYLLEKKIAD